MNPTLVTKDFTKDFNEIIKRFKSEEILVGIPEDETNRNDDSPINNATILAMNHFGSTLNNIPSRPVMSIGIRNAQTAITEQFKLCAQEALTKGRSVITKYYERVGSIASNACKKVITSQEELDPPSEATLEARDARGFKGEKALLVTGQLRNAITYVVNTKWGK